jgi:hypothetical protein
MFESQTVLRGGLNWDSCHREIGLLTFDVLELDNTREEVRWIVQLIEFDVEIPVALQS